MRRLFDILLTRIETKDDREPRWSERTRWCARIITGAIAMAFLFGIPFALPGQFTAYATAISGLPMWLASLLTMMVLIGLIGVRITGDRNRRSHDRTDDQDDDPPPPSRATTSGGEG